MCSGLSVLTVQLNIAISTCVQLVRMLEFKQWVNYGIFMCLQIYHIRQGFTGEKWLDMVNFTARPLQVFRVSEVTVVLVAHCLITVPLVF